MIKYSIKTDSKYQIIDSNNIYGNPDNKRIRLQNH